MDFICNLAQINVLICVHIYSFSFPALAESPRAFPNSNWVGLIISFMLAVILLWFSYWWLCHCHLERKVGDNLRFSCDVYTGNSYYLQNCTPTAQLEGSLCRITSASIKLGQHIIMGRYECALSGVLSDLLQYWSHLHEPFSIAKAVDARHQQRGKCFSGRKLLLPAVIKAQGTAAGSHEGTFVPTILCNGIALQESGPLWGTRGTMLNDARDRGTRGAGCKHAKVMPLVGFAYMQK